MPAEVTLTNEQKVSATIAPVTAAGNPAAVDGAPTWTVTAGDCTVNVSADGLSCEIVSGSALADSVVQVDADADLGSGVQTISDTVLVHVQGALAVSLGLSLGSPEPK